MLRRIVGRNPSDFRLRLSSILVVVAVLALSACGDDSGDETSGGGGGAESSTVDVEEMEFSINPSAGSAPAGDVTFALHNVGEETHEFVVLKTDLDPLDLPTADDGSVDEEGEGIEVVDEVEDIPSKESRELTVSLDAGNYVLICNIVEEEDGEPESHFQEGMRVNFSAE
jgi:plastocyanin